VKMLQEQSGQAFAGLASDSKKGKKSKKGKEPKPPKQPKPPREPKLKETKDSSGKETGRWTLHEDTSLLRALEEALTYYSDEVPSVEVAKNALCGRKVDESPNADAKSWKVWCRKIWAEVAKALPHRSRISCYDRGRRLLQDTKKGAWSAEELSKIEKLVEEHGTSHWKKIGEELDRPPSACKDIWRHKIANQTASATSAGKRAADKDKKRDKWTKTETEKLVKIISEHQKQSPSESDAESSKSVTSLPWIEIAKKMEGRTAEQCRLHWRAASNFVAGDDSDKSGPGYARWGNEEDAALGKQVLKQISERKVKTITDISWKLVDVAGRPPHQCKERLRRLVKPVAGAGKLDAEKSLEAIVTEIVAQAESTT